MHRILSISLEYAPYIIKKSNFKNICEFESGRIKELEVTALLGCLKKSIIGKQFRQIFTAVYQCLKVTRLFLDSVQSHIITMVHQIIHGIGCGGRRHCCGLFFFLPLGKPWTINPAKLHISALYRFTKQNTT